MVSVAALPRAIRTGVAATLCALWLAAPSTRASGLDDVTAYDTLGNIYSTRSSDARGRALRLDSTNTGAREKGSLVGELPWRQTVRPMQLAAASSTAAPATPSALNAAIQATVTAWAQAWSAKDVERYLAFYAPAFKTPHGEPRAAWEKLRRARIAGPRSIEVSISGVEVLRHDDARAAATFRQNYRSDQFQDSVSKTLELVRDGERWLIVEERVVSLAAGTGTAAAPAGGADRGVSASLGKLHVLSALGQPLRAEVEIGALQRGEHEVLSVRLASSEAFRKAGIEFDPVLRGVNMTIQLRDGKPIVAVTTRGSVNEPFLLLLIELEWKSGRLLRKYTLLLDPPTFIPPPPPDAVMGSTTSSAPAPAPTAASAKSAAPSATPAPGASGVDYEVVKGDTLAKIARQHMPTGVTMDQMLIALYRANPEAFIHDNINLVRAGRILTVPDHDSVSAVDRDEANEVVRSHRVSFGEYGRKIAAAAPIASGREDRRTAKGQITSPTGPAAPDSSKGRITAPPTPAVPDRSKGRITSPGGPAVPDSSKGQLALSRTEPGKRGGAGAAAARGDDQVASERALAEARSRIGDLEKIRADLQKLIEIRNQRIAELEKRAAQVPPALAPVAKPAVAAPEPAAPKPAVEVPKPAPAPAIPKPAPKPQPVAKPKPVAKPRPAPPAPAPAPQPSLLDEYLGDPLMLGGLGAVMLLLVGYGAYEWRKKKRAARSQFNVGLLGAAAGGAAGSSVADVGGATATAGAGEEVDPLAEADVYMAYGRDTQAEEILLEALQKDASRPIVHSKLLQIYAKRRDTKQFEATALKMKGLVNGEGPEWDKAMALGRSIDPGNGLYGRGEAAAVAPEVAMTEAPEVDFDLDAVMGTGQMQAVAPDVTQALAAPAAPAAPAVDFDLGGTTTEEPIAAQPAAPRVEVEAAPASGPIEFDLDGTTTGEPIAAEPAAPRVGAEAAPASGPTEFDLDEFNLDEPTIEAPIATEPAAPSVGAKATPELGGIEFDLGGTTEAPATAEAAPATEAAVPHTGGGHDFELSLDMDGGEAAAPANAAAPAAGRMDLSTISLDLGGTESAGTSAGNGDAKSQEIATKLDLAKTYAEIGDKDPARELLNEVVKEGDAAQQAQAQQILASLR